MGGELLGDLVFDDAEGQIDTGGNSHEQKTEEEPAEQELYLEDRYDLPHRKNPK